MSNFRIIKITSLKELGKKTRNALNLKDKCNAKILGVSGSDSVAAMVKLIKDGLIEKNSIVIPVTCWLPNLLDEVNEELAKNVKLLQKYGMQNEIIIEDSVVIDIRQLEDSIHEELTAYSKKITGSNCPGCHLTIYYVCGLLAKDLGGNIIISGGRESHDGKFKINQVDTALDEFKAILKNIGVEIIFPLRYVTKKEDVMDIIRNGMGDAYSEIQPCCDLEFGKKPLINRNNIVEHRNLLRNFTEKATHFLTSKKQNDSR